MYVWEIGCRTSTTINKTMNEKNEYNKHTYTKRERDKRERERERESMWSNITIFYNWAALVSTFQKLNSYSFYYYKSTFHEKAESKLITFRILQKI